MQYVLSNRPKLNSRAVSVVKHAHVTMWHCVGSTIVSTPHWIVDGSAASRGRGVVSVIARLGVVRRRIACVEIRRCHRTGVA